MKMDALWRPLQSLIVVFGSIAQGLYDFIYVIRTVTAILIFKSSSANELYCTYSLLDNCRSAINGLRFIAQKNIVDILGKNPDNTSFVGCICHTIHTGRHTKMPY